MKATEQYFPVVLFITLYKVVLTFESVDEFLWCYCSHETSSIELFSNSCLALYKQQIKFSFHCKLGLKRLMQRLPSKIITSKLKTWSLSVSKHAGSNGYPFLGSIDDQQCLAPWKGIWIPEYGTLLLVESGIGILGFGIRKTTQEIRIPNRLESGIQVPLTKPGIQYVESGIPGLESTIQDCHGFPSHGAKCRNSMKKLRNTPWYLRTFADYLKVFLFCFNICR